MPKKPKFTKEEVIKAGYQIIKEQGKDNLTARFLAASLNCAISPIFTLFENMEELKNEIFLYTKDEFINLMKESASYFPMFKQFGLLFISYCMDNPNLFMFLLSKTEGDISKIIYLEKDFYNLLEKNICEVFGFNNDEAKELFGKMMLIANGIGISIIEKKDNLLFKRIGTYFSEMCIGLVLQMKAKKGRLDIGDAQFLSNQTSVVPKKIK